MRRSPTYISRGILVVLIVAVTVGQARTLGEIAETNLRYSATGTAVKVMNTSKVELGERQKVLAGWLTQGRSRHGCPPPRIQLSSFASSPDTNWLTQGRSRHGCPPLRIQLPSFASSPDTNWLTQGRSRHGCPPPRIQLPSFASSPDTNWLTQGRSRHGCPPLRIQLPSFASSPDTNWLTQGRSRHGCPPLRIQQLLRFGAQGERQKDFHELDDARSPSPELPSAGATIEARTLRLYHLHTRESLTVTYKKDGRYIPEALAQLDYFLRDWRANGLASMSAETIDLMWELHEELGSKQPINIICGFRSARDQRPAEAHRSARCQPKPTCPWPGDRHAVS